VGEVGSVVGTNGNDQAVAATSNIAKRDKNFLILVMIFELDRSNFTKFGRKIK
jgi:hypothetical protein